jgi:hypothetical protein
MWEMEGALFKGSPLVDICNGNDQLRPCKRECKVFASCTGPLPVSHASSAGVAACAHGHQQQQQVQPALSLASAPLTVLAAFCDRHLPPQPVPVRLRDSSCTAGTVRSASQMKRCLIVTAELLRLCSGQGQSAQHTTARSSRMALEAAYLQVPQMPGRLAP